ncbi:uncharacterized protein LOC111518576 isoform X2 [Drosophila willistoni]|uniref:uncharacterized protein LOC111518576 isoform X2 n=1 Tax=Drosophila willistoni TaxID=7260 RepID=UPI000C26D6D6|nr:uncharacterized protein LOC111518576 isoform X2 [Drosophila willistoni]
MGNGIHIARKTADVPTHEFEPIKSDDSDWIIRQRSSSSARGLEEDNREKYIKGPVYERGFSSSGSSGYESIELPEPHVILGSASSDSNTTYRYDSWDATTQPSSVKRERNLHANDSPIPSNRKNYEIQSDADDVTPMSHLKDSQFNASNKSLHKIYLDNEEEDDFIPAERDQTRQEHKFRPQIHLDNDEEDDIVPKRRGKSRQGHGLFRKTYLDYDEKDGLVPTRRSQSRQGHGLRPSYYMDRDEADDIISIRRDRLRQGQKLLPISHLDNDEDDDLVSRKRDRSRHGLRLLPIPHLDHYPNDEGDDFVPRRRDQSRNGHGPRKIFYLNFDDEDEIVITRRRERHEPRPELNLDDAEGDDLVPSISDELPQRHGFPLKTHLQTDDILSDKFKHTKSDDSDWSIHQRSSSSARGLGEDNREKYIKGPVYKMGFSSFDSYQSYEPPEPHVTGGAASSDSNTTYRYDSWYVTTPSSVEKERNLHANNGPIHSNRRNFDTSHTQSGDGQLTAIGNKSLPKIHFDNDEEDGPVVPIRRDQSQQGDETYLGNDEKDDLVPRRRGRSRQGHGPRPKFHLDSDEADYIVPIRRDRLRQGLNLRPISYLDNNEGDDFVPRRRDQSRKGHGPRKIIYLDIDKEDDIVITRKGHSRQRPRPELNLDDNEEDDFDLAGRDKMRHAHISRPIIHLNNDEEDYLAPLRRKRSHQVHFAIKLS